LCTIGSKLLLEVIDEFSQGKINRIPQDDSKMTLAPKIELEDCEIHWQVPAPQVHNLVRGSNPHPGAWCVASIKGEQKRIKILKTVVVHGHTEVPGQIISYDKNGIVVACGLEAVRILQLQVEGKKAVLGEEFVRGHPKDQIFFLIE
jgi:methionyl-tRNA formyltransferase